MRKRIVFYVNLILIIITLVSCGPVPISWYEVVWEGEGGGSILFAHTILRDYNIVYQFESEIYQLAPVSSFDAGEDLVVMKISPDENHLVLLLENSRRYPHGTRLWVFDLSVLPDGDEFEPLLDVTDPKVLDATINNEKVDYQTPPDGWLEYTF